MNTKILIALLLASPSVFSKTLPENILKQLPLNDHSIITSASNDFDNNGLSDYVMALRDNKESNTDAHIPRFLLVFMQMSKNFYKSIARNESIVYAADDGGIGGDPFDYSDDGGLVAKGNISQLKMLLLAGFIGQISLLLSTTLL